MLWTTIVFALAFAVNADFDYFSNGACGTPNTNPLCIGSGLPQNRETFYYAPDDMVQFFTWGSTFFECDADTFARVTLWSLWANDGGEFLAECDCAPNNNGYSIQYCPGYVRGTMPEGRYHLLFLTNGNQGPGAAEFSVTHTQSTVYAPTVSSTVRIDEQTYVTTTTTTTETNTAYSAPASVTRPASSTTVVITVVQPQVTVFSTSTRTRTRTRHTESYITGTTTTTLPCTRVDLQKYIYRTKPKQLVRRVALPANPFGDGPLTTTITPTTYVQSTTTLTETDTDTSTVTTTTTLAATPATITIYSGVAVASTTTTSYKSTKSKIAYTNLYFTTTKTYTFDQRQTRTVKPVCTT